MTQNYHVTIERDGYGWRACCPALEEYGAVTGGETKEENTTLGEVCKFEILGDNLK